MVPIFGTVIACNRDKWFHPNNQKEFIMEKAALLEIIVGVGMMLTVFTVGIIRARAMARKA